MKNLELCNECETAYNEKGEAVMLNADEHTALEREQIAKWTCTTCRAKEQKRKLIAVIEDMPNNFIYFESITFADDVVNITVSLNSKQVLTTEYDM